MGCCGIITIVGTCGTLGAGGTGGTGGIGGTGGTGGTGGNGGSGGLGGIGLCCCSYDGACTNIPCSTELLELVIFGLSTNAADTGKTSKIGTEHTNNAIARTRIVFLKFILPPYLCFL